MTCCPTLSSSSSTSNFIVAPFESNANIATGVGRVYYEVHNTTTSPTLLSKVNRYIQQSTQAKFNGVWMLVVEWNSVPQSGQSTSVVGSMELCSAAQESTFNHNLFLVDQHISGDCYNQWISVLYCLHLSLWKPAVVRGCSDWIQSER